MSKKKTAKVGPTFECVACNKTLPEAKKRSHTLVLTGENTSWCWSCSDAEDQRSIAEDMVPGSQHRRTRVARSGLAPSEWPKHGYPARNPSVPLFSPAAIAKAQKTVPPVAVTAQPPAPPKPKPNLIMPVSPMFASIMVPVAKRLVKQLCKVKNQNGAIGDHINIVMETNWNQGPGNDNLEQRSLNIGTVGMVVGVAEPATVLRFLVANNNPNDDGIYHVSVLNLEPMSPVEESVNDE